MINKWVLDYSFPTFPINSIRGLIIIVKREGMSFRVRTDYKSKSPTAICTKSYAIPDFPYL